MTTSFYQSSGQSQSGIRNIKTMYFWFVDIPRNCISSKPSEERESSKIPKYTSSTPQVIPRERKSMFVCEACGLIDEFPYAQCPVCSYVPATRAQSFGSRFYSNRSFADSSFGSNAFPQTRPIYRTTSALQRWTGGVVNRMPNAYPPRQPQPRWAQARMPTHYTGSRLWGRW